MPQLHLPAESPAIYRNTKYTKQEQKAKTNKTSTHPPPPLLILLFSSVLRGYSMGSRKRGRNKQGHYEDLIQVGSASQGF